MIRIRLLAVFVLLCIGFSCRDLYEPELVSSSASYLVVEGVLNVGNGPTNIHLTRTFKLDDSATLRGENNALVSVEGKDNTTRQLTMNGDGIYTSSNLNLVLNQEYRLRIVTANGKEYLSEYIMAKKTPLIDTVNFRQNDKGVQIFVTTHDNTNSTRYYLWDFDETWEIRTYYNSGYKYVNGTVVERTAADRVSICWKYGHSTSITIGSSASYQTDSLPEAPVHFIGNGDEKLAVRYSILLRQYALDKKGYQFYELMKKNTESLGTIFDAQPSEIKGNLYCSSDPKELVIGNISATTVEEKRIFIDHSDLDGWRFTQDCPGTRIANNPDSIREAYDGGIEIYEAVVMGPSIVAYMFSWPRCVDCTRRGGSVIRPSYW